jgi:hypothetical protein
VSAARCWLAAFGWTCPSTSSAAYLWPLLWDGVADMMSLKVACDARRAGRPALPSRRRSFRLTAGAIVGVAAAASTGLLIQSGALDGDPYRCWWRCRCSSSRTCGSAGLVADPALHGLCCLFRSSTCCYHALVLAFVVLLWRPAAGARPPARVGMALVVLPHSRCLPALALAAWAHPPVRSEPPGDDDPGSGRCGAAASLS